MTMMRYRIPNNAPHQFHIKIGSFKNLEYTTGLQKIHYKYFLTQTSEFT